MNAPAETHSVDSPAPGGLVRAVRVLALMALPLCVSSPGGTVAMALLALAGLVFLSRGAQLSPVARGIFRLAAGLYLLLVVVDLANGDVFGTLIRSTGVNYLPLIAIVPVHVALTAAGVRQADLHLGFRIACFAAGLLAVPSIISLLGEGEFVPATGIFLNQIPFGLVAALMGTVCLCYAMTEQWPKAGIDALAAALAALAVLMTQSKLVWACLGLAYTTAFLISIGHIRPRWTVLGVGLTAAAVAAATTLPPVQAEMAELADAVQRVLGGDVSDETLGLRLLLSQSAFTAFLEKPLIGWGLHDQFEVVEEIVMRTARVPNGVPHIHNDYLVHLVGFGICGAVFLAGFFVLMVRVARSAGDIALRRSVFAAIPAIALYMGFDIFFNMDALTGFAGLFPGLVLSRGPESPGATA